MLNKYKRNKEIVAFYKFKSMDRSEAIQEAYSRGFCAGVDSIPKGDESKQELRLKILEQQEMIDRLNNRISNAASILGE